VCAGAARGTGLGLGTCHPYPATVLAAWASDRRSLACLGVRVQCVRRWADATVRDVARTRVWACSVAYLFQGSTADHGVFHDFVTEVDQVLISKVVGRDPSTTSTKGVWYFSQPIVHNLYANIATFWALVNSAGEC
jgi:hypothetical protein